MSVISRGGAIKAKTAATTSTAKVDSAVVEAASRSKLRNVLFPIYGEEVKRFFLIGAIKFFVILALTLTRDNKDTMVVTSCGAEAIAFLKVSYLLGHEERVERWGSSNNCVE